MTHEPNPGEDVYLAKAIEEAIGGDERTAELGVHVDVRGGRVFLHGMVATQQRKDAISSVAAEHAPNHELVNDVSVNDPGATATGTQPAEETLR
jgi:osmotically-inducible protein OsmY